MTYIRLKKTTSAFAAGLLVSALGLFSGTAMEGVVSPKTVVATCENDYCSSQNECFYGRIGFACELLQNGDCMTIECSGS